MDDLLKEAIADAKAVRETALANAKMALEEAFTPRLKSMLAQKIQHEVEDEEKDKDEIAYEVEDEEEGMGHDEEEGEHEDADEISYNEEEDDEEDHDEISYKEEEEDEEDHDEMKDESKVIEIDGVKYAPVVSEEEDEEEVEEVEDKEEGEDEMDEADELDLESILRELEEEEEEDEDKDEMKENLDEAYKVIKYLRAKINEVNLLNAKLLFSNKIFRNKSLSESQKMRVIETFDRAKSVREVKLVYTTLAESLSKSSKPRVTEGFASKGTTSTAPSKEIINENNDFATRMKRLAGL